MVVIFDLSNGKAEFFGSRQNASAFLGISLVTLRKYLKEPFYCHKSFLFTASTKERIADSLKRLQEVEV